MPAEREQEDEFLNFVFPGTSEAAHRFRSQVLELNLYCKRFKGGVNCILLTGETGVGKNYAARGISAHSQWLTMPDDERRNVFYDRQGTILLSPTALVDRLLFKEHLPSRGSKPQRVLSLATVLGPQLADDLAASELFGHRKEAFTGAAKDHPGIFGDDSVDDVLLDEIADLSPKVQTKLLQFIENRTFRPVGGIAADEKSSQHRLFLATNRPLEDWVRQGKFREDLYWRIRGYRIVIPPLRERRDTIRAIANSVLLSVNHRQRGDQQIGPSLTPDANQYCLVEEAANSATSPQYSSWVVQLTADDLRWCETYAWPGNVRELRQRMELYVFHNGHRRLKDIDVEQVDFRDGVGSRDQSPPVDSLIDLAVQDYLQKALRGDALAPGQPNTLLNHFSGLVKQAVYRFKTTNRLSREDLAKLFPDARDAETTIGRWRTAGTGSSV